MHARRGGGAAAGGRADAGEAAPAREEAEAGEAAPARKEAARQRRRVAMKSASSARSAAAKPQSPSPSPPVVQPGPDRPPMAMTTAELEAAIAALPAKKDALREAFDRLADCSPFPLPFTWGDLDAHISSLQSSISLRFRQLRVLEAARPALAVSAVAATGDDEKGKNQEEEDASEEEEEEEASEDEEEASEVVEEEEDANDEEEEASGEEVVEVEEQEAEEEEQEGNEEMQEAKEEEEAAAAAAAAETEAKKSSPVQDEEEAEEEHEEADEYMGEAQEEERQEAKKASPEQDIEEEEEEEEKGEAKKVSPEQGNPTLPIGSKDLMAACASMDAPRLVELVCKCVNIRHEFPVVMRHAPDAAALILCVVRGFLHNKEPKTAKVWGNCVGLIRCVPAVTPKLSTSMMEQAKRLAKDWKEMIDKPGSCGNLGILASWGLLYFLISYNVVSEFDADEIIRLFGTVPRKHQKKNSVELCKGLGLVSRITDLIDYLIGNGQQLDAIQLTHVFNLVDKYPPLSLLEGYVEKAKNTALDIFSKKASHKSPNPAISKEVDNLRVAQNMVEQQSTDSSKCSVIFAEIKNLLAEYAKMRTLIKASAASNAQQQQKAQQKQQEQKQNPHVKQQKQKEKNKKRKKEQEQQQQTKPQEGQQQQQQNKPQENQGQQRPKPQNKLQKQQQNEPQERQQHLKRPRPHITKLPTPVIPAPGVLPPVVPNVPQIGPFGHSPYAVMPGVHTYPGIQGGPFAPNVGAPQYMGLFNPYQLNPLYRHPSFYPR